MHLRKLCDNSNRSGVSAVVKISSVALKCEILLEALRRKIIRANGLDAAAGVKSLIFITLDHSSQHFSSLRGKGKKAHSSFGRISAIKCGTKHHICCPEVCNSRSSSWAKLVKYDVTRSFSDKFSEVSPKRSPVCDKKKIS